jgi:hypothetical protein
LPSVSRIHPSERFTRLSRNGEKTNRWKGGERILLNANVKTVPEAAVLFMNSL